MLSSFIDKGLASRVISSLLGSPLPDITPLSEGAREPMFAGITSSARTDSIADVDEDALPAQMHTDVQARAASGPFFLPNELWCEIARFSVRQDVLNLRAVNSEMKLQVDGAIRTMTLSRHKDLVSFTGSESFQEVTTLRLNDVNSRSLHFLAQHLRNRPRENLSMTIRNSHRYLSPGLTALSRCALARLELTNVTMTPDVIDALVHCRCAVRLSGDFFGDALMKASCLASLTRLSGASFHMNDQVAHRLSEQQTLEVLVLKDCPNLSASGLAKIASIPTLRMLVLDDARGVASLINNDVACHLADNPCLQSLAIISARFEEDALCTLLSRLGARRLYLSNVSLHRQAVMALCANSHLRELILVNAALDAGDAVALLAHLRRVEITMK